jgi:hypothetical protein
LTAVLLVGKSNVALASKDKPNSLYVANYIPGPWSHNNNSFTEGTTQGNIVLVNPTSTSLSNLKLAIQVDGSEITYPSLRLWDSNYTLNTPNSFSQSVHLFEDITNFSTPIALISIKAIQQETVSLSIPSQHSFLFSSHNLKVYISQNNFGDIIRGQLLIVPQTQAYLQVMKYSSVETDDTYHLHYDTSYKEDMMILDNPNFFQRYHNETGYPIYPENYGLMRAMGVLGDTYFNVTVFNNNTFPVDSVALQGQIPSQETYRTIGGALIDYVMQPNETYYFPVAQHELPSYAYVTGYVFNNSVPASPSPTATVPEFPTLIILTLFAVATFLPIVLTKRRKAKSKKLNFLHFVF